MTGPLSNHCIVCFHQSDRAILLNHHHCCNKHCEDKYNEIVGWERGQFGQSYLEEIAKRY